MYVKALGPIKKPESIINGLESLLKMNLQGKIKEKALWKLLTSSFKILLLEQRRFITLSIVIVRIHSVIPESIWAINTTPNVTDQETISVHH